MAEKNERPIKIEPKIDICLVQFKFDRVVHIHSNPPYNKSWTAMMSFM